MKLLWISLILCLLGCRSVSKSSEIRAEIVEKKDIKIVESIAVSAVRNDSMLRVEHKDYKVDTEETVVETNWSVPDSVGRQYPIKTVYKTAKSAVSETSGAATTVFALTITDSVVAREIQDAGITEITVSETETVKKKNRPAAMIFAVGAAFAILFILLLLKLKKWN